MNLDIKTAVVALIVMAALGGLILFLGGLRTIRTGQKLPFFRKRQDLLARGWRSVFMAVLLVVFAVVIGRFGEPAAYKVFPPSPTITQTPTIKIGRAHV